MNKHWIEHAGIGKIFVEKVLVDCGFPLLFISIDKSMNKRFLTLCIEDGEDYLLAECDRDVLLKILRQEQSIRSGFERAKKILRITYDNDIVVKPLQQIDVDKDELPGDNLMLETEIDVQTYIEDLQNNKFFVEYSYQQTKSTQVKHEVVQVASDGGWYSQTAPCS